MCIFIANGIVIDNRCEKVIQVYVRSNMLQMLTIRCFTRALAVLQNCLSYLKQFNNVQLYYHFDTNSKIIKTKL